MGRYTEGMPYFKERDSYPYRFSSLMLDCEHVCQAMFPAMRALTEATEDPTNLNYPCRRVFAEGVAELLCNQVVENARPSDVRSDPYIEFDEDNPVSNFESYRTN